jgi:DNA-binding MarR family transcriptional regulator
MDATSTGTADLHYSDLAPMLLAASSDVAMARAERSALAAGFRVGARMPVELAKARIEQQISATALWVELDSDRGPAMDELLAQISRDVGDGRYAAVVSATADLLDPVAAALETSAVELIIDADDAQRIAALALATSKLGMPLLVSDIASDNNAERLRQLSEEVSRIASTLARLSTGPGAAIRVIDQPTPGDVPPLSADTVRSVFRARRLRARYFRDELFADPAWDMLLDLLQAEIAQLRVPVSSLCIAAAVPATTALRWLKTMVSEGLFLRRADPHDGRRVFVELAPEASHALRRYFAEVGQVALI